MRELEADQHFESGAAHRLADDGAGPDLFTGTQYLFAASHWVLCPLNSKLDFPQSTKAPKHQRGRGASGDHVRFDVADSLRGATTSLRWIVAVSPNRLAAAAPLVLWCFGALGETAALSAAIASEN